MERAPRLEGAGDYGVWRVRIDAYLQARGAQNAHVRSVTQSEFAARRAAVDAWDAEDDDRSFGLSAAAAAAAAADDEPAATRKAAAATSSTKKESGASPEINSRTAELEQRRHARALMARSDMAYGTLLSALPEQLQQQTQHTIARGHAYGLWNWLETKFQNTERDNVGALWQQWTALQQEAEESFDAYRARVTNTLALLTRAKQYVSTEQQLFALIDRLRPEYKPAALALKSGSQVKDVKPVERLVKVTEAPFDFDAIAAFLNAHERAEMRADGATSLDMAAAAMGGRRADYDRRDQHGGEHEPAWKTDPCFTCGKVGHPARRCPKGYFARNEKNTRGQRENERRGHGSRSTASDDEDELSASCTRAGSLPDGDDSRRATTSLPTGGSARATHPNDTNARTHARTNGGSKHGLKRGTGPTLSIDTMCSTHCTNDKERLTGLRTVAPTRVRVANGAVIEVTLAGNMEVSVMAKKIGGSGTLRKKTLSIQNVYYHPSFTSTLISWGLLRKRGWQLESMESGSAMTAQNGWRVPLCNYGELLVLATDDLRQPDRQPADAGGEDREEPDDSGGWTEVKRKKRKYERTQKK